MPTRAIRPATLLSTALAGAAGLGLAACGTDTIKADQLERNTVREYAARGVPLTDVSCADDVEAEVGATISCTARNPSGTKLNLSGRVTAIEDGKVKHQVLNAVSGVADGEQVAKEMLRLVQDRIGRRARTLSCPTEVPIPTRSPVVCSLVKSDGKTYDASATIDARSRLSLDVAARPR